MRIGNMQQLQFHCICPPGPSPENVRQCFERAKRMENFSNRFAKDLRHELSQKIETRKAQQEYYMRRKRDSPDAERRHQAEEKIKEIQRQVDKIRRSMEWVEEKRGSIFCDIWRNFGGCHPEKRGLRLLEREMDWSRRKISVSGNYCKCSRFTGLHMIYTGLEHDTLYSTQKITPHSANMKLSFTRRVSCCCVVRITWCHMRLYWNFISQVIYVYHQLIWPRSVWIAFHIEYALCIFPFVLARIFSLFGFRFDFLRVTFVPKSCRYSYIKTLFDFPGAL